jgi:hypothetical protein
MVPVRAEIDTSSIPQHETPSSVMRFGMEINPTHKSSTSYYVTKQCRNDSFPNL